MLITASECADTLGVSPTDTLLVRLVTSTDAWAKRQLSRNFERATYSLITRGHGVSMVYLRESPIRELVEIRIDPRARFGNETVIPLVRFTFNSDPFDDDNRLYLSEGVFPDGPGTVRVLGEFGWWAADDPDHVSDLPEDLREKLIERVCAKYKQGADEEMKSQSSGDWSVTKFDELDTRILASLRHYRR